MQIQGLRTTIPQAAGILKKFSANIQAVQRVVQNQTGNNVKNLVSVKI